jgi:hypothetical protein
LRTSDAARSAVLAAAARSAGVGSIKVWLVINWAEPSSHIGADIKNLIEMKACNRDLLVLVKDEHMNEKSMERELEQLNDLLFRFETIDSFCVAHEIFDINRHKTLDKRDNVQRIIREKELRPFFFICNKN